MRLKFWKRIKGYGRKFGTHLKKEIVENVNMNENSDRKVKRKPRQSWALEFAGVWHRQLKSRKLSHEKEENLFRDLTLKPQGQVRVNETRCFRKNRKNGNSQLNIKLGN